MDNEFDFLLCERCQKEVERPTLVSCFHNLCSKCREESKPIGLCPICGTPHSQNADTPNLLFGSLQAKLRIYQKITESSDLICDSCKKEKSGFWCSNCEEFLCKPCFQCHQRFLKKEGHEARSLKDLKAESSKDFLAGFRTVSTMGCSNHNNQSLSLYCKECRQSMCCTCALLDGKHVGQHCEIQKEIQCRKDELQSMNMELKVKKVHYLATWRSLHDLVKNKEKVKNETTEWIQQKIDAVLEMVKKKGEKLLTAVEEQHSQDVRDITVKIQHVKGMVRRMCSSEQLMEMMHLYASNQEVMDMQPFIRECVEELKSKQPPSVDFQVQSENYTDVKNQLQALFRRITAEEEGLPTVLEEAPQQNCSVNLPAKRKYVQEEKATQMAAKVIKTEPDDNEGMTSARQASCSWFKPPGISSASVGTEHITDITVSPSPSKGTDFTGLAILPVQTGAAPCQSFWPMQSNPMRINPPCASTSMRNISPCATFPHAQPPPCASSPMHINPPCGSSGGSIGSNPNSPLPTSPFFHLPVRMTRCPNSKKRTSIPKIPDIPAKILTYFKKCRTPKKM